MYHLPLLGDCIIGGTASAKRCRACWLKICLQTYTIPEVTRAELTTNNFLPKLSSAPHVSLISVDTANVNHHEPVISHPVNEVATSTIERKKDGRRPRAEEKEPNKDGLLMMVPTVSVAVTDSPQPGTISSPGSQVSLQQSPSPRQQPSPAPKSLKDIRVKRGKVVFAQKESPLVPSNTTPIIQVMQEEGMSPKMLPSQMWSEKPPLAASLSQDLKVEQDRSSRILKTEIRGPRTKNVCRTSITGLPRATFGSIEDDEDERDDDFGRESEENIDSDDSEENIDSDDSDNIPLHDYIWKVIAEDQAKAGENGSQDEPEPIKTPKKSRSKIVVTNGGGKKTNGIQVEQKSVSKKTKEVKDGQVLGKKSVKPDCKNREPKRVKDSNKTPSRKNSQSGQNDPKTKHVDFTPMVEKVPSPCVANLNSDTDIEECVDEEEPIKVSNKKTKRKISSDDENRKVKKAKKRKKTVVSESQEKTIEPLTIKTTGFCSCPVPVLKTPPDQVDLNGHSDPVVTNVSESESPVKKKRKKDVRMKKESDPSENVAKSQEEEEDSRLKKNRTPSDRQKARKRCNECTGCKAEDCGSCAPCKDKKKFGGPNVRKQACKMRQCLALMYSASIPVSQNADGESVKKSGLPMKESVKNQAYQ